VTYHLMVGMLNGSSLRLEVSPEDAKDLEDLKDLGQTSPDGWVKIKGINAMISFNWGSVECYTVSRESDVEEAKDVEDFQSTNKE